MANCILCGQKVGLLDRKNFMFHGTVQTLCIGCTARLDSAAPQEREELFRQMLDSPDLEDGERIRADLNTRKALSRLRRDAGAPAAEFLHRRGRLWGIDFPWAGTV